MVSVVCVPTPLWCGDGVLPPPVIIQAGSIGIPWRGGVDPTTIDRRMSLEDVRWCVLTCVCVIWGECCGCRVESEGCVFWGRACSAVVWAIFLLRLLDVSDAVVIFESVQKGSQTEPHPSSSVLPGALELLKGPEEGHWIITTRESGHAAPRRQSL